MLYGGDLCAWEIKKKTGGEGEEIDEWTVAS